MQMNSTREALIKLSDVFSDSSKECINAVLGKEPTVREPWRIVDRLSGEFTHVLSIGNSNQAYKAVLSLGLEEETIKYLVDDTIEEQIDVFAEFINILCGLIMDQPRFTSCFGVLRQSVPIYASGLVYFPRVPGIEGKIWIEEKYWIQVGYAIQFSG